MASTTAAAPAVAPKSKKSVALSGVTAGNTALCTVGRTGNDLHYRGYDILDIAEKCEFEEIAFLLVHGKLPNAAELCRLQDQAQVAARHSERRALGAGGDSGRRAPHGRDAHRVLRAGKRAARGRGPQARALARHRRPPHGEPGLDAALLAPLLAFRKAHRRRDRRRLHRRPFPAPAARAQAPGAVGALDAHLAQPLRRARVQRLDLHRARGRRHRLGHVLGHHRRRSAR